MSAPTLALGLEREQAEFHAFAESMRAHMFSEHRQYLQAYAGLLELLALYIASLFAELPAGLVDAATAQRTARDFIIGKIQDAQVVIEIQRPAGVTSAAAGA